MHGIVFFLPGHEHNTVKDAQSSKYHSSKTCIAGSFRTTVDASLLVMYPRQNGWLIPHTIHVWYIFYGCFSWQNMVNVGKYTIYGCYGFVIVAHL